MKKNLSAIIAIALIGLLAASCSKSSSSSSNKDKLVGSWNMIKMATDSNNNGTADAAEWETLPSGFTGTIKINADGTGFQSVMMGATIVDTSSFHWAVNGDYITSVDAGTTPNTSVLHIETLDDHNLTVKDTTQPATWTVLSK